MSRRLLVLVVLLLLLPGIGQADPDTTVTLDVGQSGKPFPHFWETTFGSGRAILTLRDSWRRDARAVHSATGFQYVRFHAIFHDEVGLYQEADGQPVYNFTYIDQIYDGLLENHLRPYVELSFTPKALAPDHPVIHPFWYRQITSPPRDWSRWDAMMVAFAHHLVERYGIEEVSTWPFEVWNEPNIDFWAGDPKEATYYDLYDHTARALKGVSSRLQVGGPATAQAAWVDRFIAHCVANQVPVDFISTHVYANDTSKDVFGTEDSISRRDMVARAVRKVHDQIQASARPDLPLVFSEFNASYMNEVAVTDSPFIGPWLADTIRQTDGLVHTMAYWCISDVFEEQGVARRPFYGGFGLLAPGGIPKASFNVFAILHKLGTTRLGAASDDVLLTRGGNHHYVAALWNYAAPDATGSPRTFTVRLPGGKNFEHATLWRVDDTHGNSLAAWKSMGSPDFPSRAQQVALRQAGTLPAPEHLAPSASLSMSIPVHGLVVLEFDTQR